MSQLDYGIIGNCQFSALVDMQGSIVWCCMPRFDSASIFASLLDAERGGSWRIDPVSLSGSKDWNTRQYYLRNTNVLVTTVTLADDSQYEIVDFAPRFRRGDVYYKPPQIIRIVRPLRGIPRIVVRCRPKFNYGKDEPKVLDLASQIGFEGNGYSVHLTSDAPISYILNETPFELKESKHFVLSYGAPFEGTLKFDVDNNWIELLAIGDIGQNIAASLLNFKMK